MYSFSEPEKPLKGKTITETVMHKLFFRNCFADVRTGPRECTDSKGGICIVPQLF